MKQRSYRQSCHIAYALDVLGERWTLLIIRELLLGPKSFGKLLEHLEGMGTNLLTKRLGELVQRNILKKRNVPEDARKKQYSLTELGRALEPLMRELILWGNQIEANDQDTYHGEWDLIAMRLLYQKNLAPEINDIVRIKTPETDLLIKVDQDGLSFPESHPGAPRFEIHAPREILVKIFQRHPEREHLIKQIKVLGNRTEALQWCRAFGAPTSYPPS